ncbi:hypothetical protein BSKO_00270 [Bryopsis sp. KO-2023]|nr:hypothetical protein BSKO_00270 [Bryopsis sp. KO-2023]
MKVKEEWSKALPGLDYKQCRQAAAALLLHVEKQNKEGPQTLFEDEKKIWLDVRFKKCPALNFSRGSPYALPVVHSIHDRIPEVCLLIKGGPQDNMKKPFKEKLVPGCVQKIITDNALKRKYVDHEAKYQLATQFDIFLANQSMIFDLPRLLGKPFYKSRKFPALVQLKKSDKDSWESRIDAKKMCTFWHATPGVKAAVRIGLASFKAKEVVENLFSALSSMCSSLPNGFSEILRVSIRGPDTTLLPVYQTLPDLPCQVSDAGVLDLDVSSRNNRVEDGGRTVNARPKVEGEDEEDMKMRERANEILDDIMSRDKWQMQFGLKRRRDPTKIKKKEDANGVGEADRESKRLKQDSEDSQ